MIKAICIACMDYRFQGKLNKYIHEDLGYDYGDYDLVTIAGGAGNFEQLEHHLKLAKQLHQPEHIIITCHEDCGAGKNQKHLEEAVGKTRCIFVNEKITKHYFTLK